MGHKHRKNRKHKRRPRPDFCEACGEGDLKIVPVIVQVDGKKHFGWYLCRACAAGKIVLLTTTRRH